MNIISNCSFIDCGIGISAPKSANLIISGAYFERVNTCYQFRDDNEPLQPIRVSKIEKVSIPKKKRVYLSSLEKDSRRIIHNLFNLEITARITNDLYTLKQIRKLKGLVGSKYFQTNYSLLLQGQARNQSND
jgi:hypothetical protein